MKRLCLIVLLALLSPLSHAQRQLWGMCSAGTGTYGTIFKTDSNGSGYTDVYAFSDTSMGIEPYGSLMPATDGNLYGMTSRGGAFGYGVIFQVDPASGVYTLKHSFDSLNGSTSYGTLCQAANGKLYGLTYRGGSGVWPNKGVMFEYDPTTNVFIKKLDLINSNCAYPYGSLTEFTDGNLYGLISAGGVDATGMLFKYDIAANAIIQIHSFIAGPLWEGYAPQGNVIQATNGRHYGFSRYGAAMGSGGGVIFEYNPDGPILDKMTALHKLSEDHPDSLAGYELYGTPVQAANGKLYGMSNRGGTGGAGAIFEYDLATNTYTKLHDLDSTTEGYQPYGSLMQAADGDLYGLTTSPEGQARMFRFHISTNTLTVVANVTGTPWYTTLVETPQVTASVATTTTTNAISLYPDPASTTLNITLPRALRTEEVTIADIAGRVAKRLAGNHQTIDIGDLPGGVYFIHITAANHAFHSRFVKQ